jgi:hypothetical protein
MSAPGCVEEAPLRMCLSPLAASQRCCERGSVDFDRNGLCILVPGECVALLATGRVGRIALSQSALPTIMPVLYEVVGTSVKFQASAGLLATAAERGDVVCFESDFANADERALWSVLVVGRLEIVPTDGARRAAVPDPLGARPFGSTSVALPMTIVSGRATVEGLRLAQDHDA